MFVELLLAGIALVFLLRTVRQVRRGHLTKLQGAAWFMLWCAVLLTSIFVRQSDVLAQALGVQRAADLVVYLAIIVLLIIIFRQALAMSKLQDQLAELVRRLALDKTHQEIAKDQ